MITIIGTILDSQGRPSHCKIGVLSLSTPSSLTGGVIVATTKEIIFNSSSDGSFSIGLEAGDYKITYYQSAVTLDSIFQISVPSGSSTIAITDLITTSLTYTYSAPPNTIWNGQLPQDISLTVDGQVAIEGNSGNPVIKFRYGGTVYTAGGGAGGTVGNLTEATSSILTIVGGTNAVNGTGTTIQVKQASSSQNGFLSSADWTTFNNKLSSLTTGNLTENTSGVLTITGGTGAVIGGGATIQVKLATTSVDGYLSHTDWNTFSGKENALTFSSPLVRSTNAISIQDAAADGTTKGAATFAAADFNSSAGLISIDYANGQAASGSVKGLLTAADWTTFNSKQAALGYTPVNKAGDTGIGNLGVSSITPIIGILDDANGGTVAILVDDDHYLNDRDGANLLQFSTYIQVLGKFEIVTANVSGASSDSAVSIAGVWNTTGVPTAIKLSLTDTASDSSSKFLDFILSGTSRFSVLKNGEMVMPVGAVDGYVLTCDANGRSSWQNPSSGGTVTSIAMSVPAFLSVAGSPITSAGTLAVTLATQAANLVFASPSSGSAAAPTFRSLVSADLPSTITGVTWNGSVVSEVYGGTNQSSYILGDILYASAANTLSKLHGNASATRKFLLQIGNGTISAAPSWSVISSTDVDTALGYTPANVAGDNFTGSISTTGNISCRNLTVTTGGLVVGSLAFTADNTGNVAANSLTIVAASSFDNGALTTNGSGVITAGTWHGTLIGATYGGTGVNNGSSTITLGGNLTTSGAFTTTLTVTANTSVTLPTSGTLVNTAVTALSSLASIGTITTGVWNGTAIAAGFGGTGQSSYAVGDILYASASTTLSKLAGVATGNALISGGVTTAPSWGKIGLTTHISGTLAEGNGGTNQTTYALGDLLYSSATNTLAKLAGNTTSTKKFLTQTGTGSVSAAPSWTTLSSTDVGLGSVTNNAQIKISDYSAKGILLVGTGVGTFAGLSVGTNGYAIVADSTQTSGVKWAAVSASPAGSDTHIQFNNGGAFGGSAGFTFNKDELNPVVNIGVLANSDSSALTFTTDNNNDNGSDVASIIWNPVSGTPQGLIISTAGLTGNAGEFGHIVLNTPAASFVGINTGVTAPAYTLDVNGTIRATALIVTGSTKLIGAVNVLFDHYADAGNTTTGETDLFSDTVAASQLANNGEKLYAHYSGTFVQSATATRTMRVYFAGTKIFDSGALTANVASAAWSIEVNIIRVSSSTVRCDVTAVTDGVTVTSSVAYTSIGSLTLTNTQILKITGQAGSTGAATNDILAKIGVVQWIAAA